MFKRKTEVDNLLAEYKKKMPATVYLVKSEEQFDKIIRAIDTITDFALRTSPDAKIEVTPCPLNPSSINMTISTDEIIVDNPQEFFEAISVSANFEMYPRKIGKLSAVALGIVFNDAYSPAPAQNDPFLEYHKDYGKPVIKRDMK